MIHKHDLSGFLASFTLGGIAISLGCKGFTPKGLPWTKTKNITGTSAKILGALCMLIGAAFICFGLYGLSLAK
jgi:hypothetical protein